MKALFGVSIVSLLAVAAPVFAHQSFAAEYDSAKPVGDPIIVDGYPAKGGSSLANARNVELAYGRKLFAGSTDDGSPQK